MTELAIRMLIVSLSTGRLFTSHPSTSFFSSHKTGAKTTGTLKLALTATSTGVSGPKTYSSPLSISHATIVSGIGASEIFFHPNSVWRKSCSFFHPITPSHFEISTNFSYRKDSMISEISFQSFPKAYMDPMIAPMLVPDTSETWMSFSEIYRSTPM